MRSLMPPGCPERVTYYLREMHWSDGSSSRERAPFMPGHFEEAGLGHLLRCPDGLRKGIPLTSALNLVVHWNFMSRSYFNPRYRYRVCVPLTTPTQETTTVKTTIEYSSKQVPFSELKPGDMFRCPSSGCVAMKTRKTSANTNSLIVSAGSNGDGLQPGYLNSWGEHEQVIPAEEVVIRF